MATAPLFEASVVNGLALPTFGASGSFVIHSLVDGQARWWLRVTDGERWFQLHMETHVIEEQATRIRKPVTEVARHFVAKFVEGLLSVTLSKTKNSTTVCHVKDLDGLYLLELHELLGDRCHDANREFIFAVASACRKRGGHIADESSKDGDENLLSQIRNLTDELSLLKSQQHTHSSGSSGPLSLVVSAGPDIPLAVQPGKRPNTGKMSHPTKRKAGTSIINPWTKSGPHAHRAEFEDEQDDTG